MSKGRTYITQHHLGPENDMVFFCRTRNQHGSGLIACDELSVKKVE